MANLGSSPSNAVREGGVGGHATREIQIGDLFLRARSCLSCSKISLFFVNIVAGKTKATLSGLHPKLNMASKLSASISTWSSILWGC